MGLHIILLIVGMIILIEGANLFVSGSSGIARCMKVPPIVIGLTIVSIGTSLPELTVNVISSIRHLNDLALGNIAGSNIFDIFIVIGFCALFVPLIISCDVKKYDIPILILTYGILVLFMFVITPYSIDRIEGIILLILSILYIVFLVYRGKTGEVDEEETKKKWYVYLILLVLGLAGLVFGGRFVVNGASYLASYLGMSDLFIALTVVSIGTSLPEVTTSVLAIIKGENDIAVGNAIGSCIFNVLLIIGISSVIYPITFDSVIIFDVVVMVLSSVIVLILSRFKRINNIAGILMIMMYSGYIIYIIMRSII